MIEASKYFVVAKVSINGGKCGLGVVNGYYKTHAGAQIKGEFGGFNAGGVPSNPRNVGNCYAAVGSDDHAITCFCAHLTRHTQTCLFESRGPSNSPSTGRFFTNSLIRIT